MRFSARPIVLPARVRLRESPVWMVASRVAAATLLAGGVLVAASPAARPDPDGGPGAHAGPGAYGGPGAYAGPGAYGGPGSTRFRPVALTAAEERIAYIGTGHRGIGVINGDGADSSADPFFPDTPVHFDDEVSARGDTVVWTSRRDTATAEVYLRAGTGPVTRVTRNTTTEWHPVLSPDGTHIAFHSGAGRSGGGNDIFVVATGGGTPLRVTDGIGDNTWPSWSPDGSSIAFQGRRGGSVPQVYQVPAGGGAVSPLTGFAEGGGEPAWDPNPGNNRLVFTVAPDDQADRTIAVLRPGGGAQGLGGWDGHRASWSPDGTTLAFLSTTPPGGGDRDGLDRVYTGRLSPDLCSCELTLRLSEDRWVGTPTWYTPPGGGALRLLVSRTNAPNCRDATLQDVRADGSDPRDLGLVVLREDPGADGNPDLIYRPTNGDPWYGRPAYSPDGRRIAVTRFETVDGRRTGSTWIVNADGGSPRQIPLAGRVPGGVDKNPAWSPDGTRIALAVQEPGGPFRIVVVDPADGRRAVTVPGAGADSTVSDLTPAWSADGTTLAFTRGDPDDPANPASHVWLADATDGLDQWDLTEAVCGDCAGDGRAIVDYSPAFSPDGTRIAFSRRDDGVLVTDLDGGDCRVVLPRAPAGALGCAVAVTAGPNGPHTPRDVVWSADAEHLVFSARRDAERTSAEQIKAVELATGQLTGLTSALPGRQKYPTVQRALDVATSLVEPPDPTTVGNPAGLTVEVRDNGPDPAMRTRLAFTVPAGLRLTGLEPQPGAPPGATCEIARARCDLGRLDPGRTVRVRVELTGVSVGNFELPWTVDGGLADTNPPDNRATTTVRVDPPPPNSPASPRITVTVNPAPAYVGGTATVTYTVLNAGGTTSTGTRVRPRLPAGVPLRTLPAQCPTAAECRIADLPPGRSATFAIVLGPKAPVRTTVSGTATMTGTGSATARAPFVVLQPRIVAVPPIGPPGFVPSIRGTDFPPGVRVRLTWSVGVTVAANPTVPAANGRFAAPLLILPKDQVGPRKVTATGAGFSPVQCDFLVTVPAQQPPNLVQRR